MKRRMTMGGCPGGWGLFSNDYMQLCGVHPMPDSPVALVRGGYHQDGTNAGPFSITAGPLYYAFNDIGFRCAR